MNKETLIEIIEKYYLGGLTEQVRLKINDNKLVINFATILKDCIGELQCPFIFNNTELGIYDTTQFYKLIKVLTDPINIEVIEKNNKALSLEIKDSQFNLTYNLADLGLISEGKLSNQLPQHVLSLGISDEFITKFIKAHNALEKAETFQLKTIDTKKDPQSLKFTIGLTDKFSNKISFTEPCIEYQEMQNYVYRVNNLREILNNNKGSEITMLLYSMGVIEIQTKNITTNLIMKYYLVPNKN